MYAGFSLSWLIKCNAKYSPPEFLKAAVPCGSKFSIFCGSVALVNSLDSAFRATTRENRVGTNLHRKALQKYFLHSRGVKQLGRGSEDTVKDEPRTKEKEKEEQKETVQKMRRKEK